MQWDVNLIDLVKSFLTFEQDPLSNEYLVARLGFSTAKNESLKVCKELQQSQDRLSINMVRFYLNPHLSKAECKFT